MTVYFDNAATTRVCPEAADAVLDAMTVHYANPSSAHAPGRAAKRILEQARASVAAALGAQPGEIYFTSGGTEADNWALLGGADAMRHTGRHIITSLAEHDAVLASAAQLKKEGFEVTLLRPDASGAVPASAVAAALRPDTALVSLMLVNNETGAVSAVREVRDAMDAAGSRALLHTDAVQAFGKLAFSPASLGADLVSVSSHKIHGPKGAGALFIRRGVRLSPRVFGGTQENGQRPGTEALPAIAGFGAAAARASAELADTAGRLHRLRALAQERITAAVPDAVFIGGGSDSILNLSLPGHRSEVLMNWLDAQGVCVSRSSACKKGARSHVLEAMGLPPKIIDGSIRVSFSRFNTEEEVVRFAGLLGEAARRILRPLG